MTVVHLLSNIVAASTHLAGVLESCQLEGESADLIEDKTLSSGKEEVSYQIRPLFLITS